VPWISLMSNSWRFQCWRVHDWMGSVLTAW
jgi:hypothetical protein